jgi:hypothetical protein
MANGEVAGWEVVDGLAVLETGICQLETGNR